MQVVLTGIIPLLAPAQEMAVLCTGVSQLRDPYLDIRYRSQMSNVGAMDAKLGGLEGIQAILDEVSDGEDGFGIISAQLDKMYDALQQLTDQTGHDVYDTQVRAAADALASKSIPTPTGSVNCTTTHWPATSRM